MPVTASRNSVGKDTGIVVKGGMEATDTKPLIKIYESIADIKLVPQFNNYIQARRSQLLNKRGIKTSMSNKDIKKAISEYNNLDANQKSLFDNGVVELRQFSRTMLELHRRVGIISDKEKT